MSNDSIQLSLTLLVLGLLFGIGFGTVIGRSISSPIDHLRESIEGLASGQVDQALPYVEYKNELGAVARSLRSLQNTVREMEDSRWIKAHGSEISAALQQAEDLRKLTQSAISRIAQVLKAGHGAFYVLSGENQLSLLASYGYRERKHLNNSFSMGEGLVGQCAMEKTAILLTAPQNYIQINSGLGEAPPACISVLPIIHDNRVLGVLEIASFQQFTAREIALLDALVPALATTMEIMDRNQRTRDLLVATQEQAERMEKQAAQLEEQTVEMEAQQAELLETENWFRSIIETAPGGMLVSNESALIVLANPRAEALFGYANGDLVGTPLSNIIPADVFSNLQNSSGIVQGIHKDGQHFNLELNISQLPSRGRHGHCASIALRAA
jgi:PAS domain S-box-containing protein